MAPRAQSIILRRDWRCDDWKQLLLAQEALLWALPASDPAERQPLADALRPRGSVYVAWNGLSGC
eukprot:9068623-Alexandrium_andersonii.AAC.1